MCIFNIKSIKILIIIDANTNTDTKIILLVITSPSFALVNEYAGRCPFFHMDLYRLEGPGDVTASGLDEYLLMEGVVAVEWAERWPAMLDESCILVSFIILDDNRREIILSGRGPRSHELLGALKTGKLRHS